MRRRGSCETVSCAVAAVGRAEAAEAVVWWEFPSAPGGEGICLPTPFFYYDTTSKFSRFFSQWCIPGMLRVLKDKTTTDDRNNIKNDSSFYLLTCSLPYVQYRTSHFLVRSPVHLLEKYLFFYHTLSIFYLSSSSSLVFLLLLLNLSTSSPLQVFLVCFRHCWFVYNNLHRF